MKKAYSVGLEKAYALFFAPSLMIFSPLFLVFLLETRGIVTDLLYLAFPCMKLCIPVLHFFIVCRFFQSSEKPRSKKILVIAASVLILMASSALIHFLIWRNKTGLLMTSVDLVWSIFCGVWMPFHTAIFRHFPNKAFFKTVIALEAVAALFINGFFTYYLKHFTPSLLIGIVRGIDGVEFYLLSISAVLLSMCSYLVGRAVSKRFAAGKLLLWFVGILSSEFVTLYLLGTPHTPPTTSILGFLMWIVPSLVMFSFSLLGLKKRRRLESSSQLEKQTDEISSSQI